MLQKGDLYLPEKEITKKCWVKEEKFYELAQKDPLKFWERLAEKIFWWQKWDKVFVHHPPYFQWFVNGKMNITYNIFEKNCAGWKKIKNKTAIIWEPEILEEQSVKITYGELLEQVCKTANALKKLGVKKGDRVGIYLPMIPQAVVAMLACARIGAVHSVVFSAFSPGALKTRLQDAQAKILITSDGYYRRGKIINLKENADQAVLDTAVEKIIVVKRANNSIYWQEGRDLWWHDCIEKESAQCVPEIMDSEDPFFILYTSGSTGKPKGVLHTCGGYMVQTYWTGKWIFNFLEDSLLWCTSDLGWITGHSYTCYSPLLNGITTLMFEGAPDWPGADRWAQIIEKHKVTIFYTAPTAIRMFEKYGADILQKYSFRTLKILGSVGEPIDESAWHWYFKEVGKERCPLVDTWWQTETGGILITSLPGVGPFKPCFTGRPLPGIKIEILDEQGKPVQVNQKGNLVVLPPFGPGLLRGIYQNPQKYKETYWSQYGENIYFTSDAALRDENGLIRIMGRVDDVLKVAGHRISTGEMENVICRQKDFLEAAVVGKADEIKGEVPVVFAVSQSQETSDVLQKAVIEQIRREIGPIAMPADVYIVPDLPKTRSGKIMRRVLKKMIQNEDLGDLSTLANPEVVQSIAQIMQKQSSASA